MKPFTKNVLQTASHEERPEHLGHEPNRTGAEREPTNTRDGTRTKTALSDAAGQVVNRSVVFHDQGAVLAA
ncbi:transposase-like protein [Saccharopolyspora lacisalsi]|uniref:Transposase-like protein n=1 Tax=Halosaccharopolyspora lacisalsi TaxID=1000566 RepID=A0A839DZL4_9PSEU|nr:hypothetical protein [Halosaccharopolyspora lacisalsi]MBA8824927.1 transposase-like protein [Halosaccharopolyspora lacisalsi]